MTYTWAQKKAILKSWAFIPNTARINTDSNNPMVPRSPEIIIVIFMGPPFNMSYTSSNDKPMLVRPNNNRNK